MYEKIYIYVSKDIFIETDIYIYKRYLKRDKIAMWAAAAGRFRLCFARDLGGQCFGLFRHCFGFGR